MPLLLALIVAATLLLAPSWSPWGGSGNSGPTLPRGSSEGETTDYLNALVALRRSSWPFVDNSFRSFADRRSVVSAEQSPPELFTDVSLQAGITWKHFNGQSQDRFLIEASCGGVAFLDFDNDGWLDIFFVNGGETPQGKSRAPVRNALYRNLGNGRFEDVAQDAGVAEAPFFGMGAAGADYDNDGFQDLFVTGFPTSALYHNEGDGTFREVTRQAGLENAGEWAAGAVWFDYDRDRLLDLFVCNYAELSFAHPRPCNFAGKPEYCSQRAYPPRRPKLYRNNGAGAFIDVSRSSGVSRHLGRAFGVVSVDIDDDGWDDLFVAGDASPDLLLLNRKDGSFEDRGFDAEIAYSVNGEARAGMGVDAADLNGDGRPDFIVTNFHDEYHALYLSTPELLYREWTRPSGLAGFTRPFVGWGTRFIDYDNDSDLDLVIVNGHVSQTIELSRRDIRYRQLPLLLANVGDLKFRNMASRAGPVFQTRHSARGMATGDYDNDGDMDVVFVRLNERPVLLRNNIGQEGAWIGFELEGNLSNRDAIGSKLSLKSGDKRFTRWVTGGASFLASHDRRVVFGLGKAVKGGCSLEIRWPGGTVQTVSGLEINRYHKIVERDETPGGEKKASGDGKDKKGSVNR